MMENQDREQEDRHDIQLSAYLRSIGATSLAAELDDLRFRNRIVEHQLWLESHHAKISEQELHREKYDQRLIENQAALFDKAQAYNNFVVTLGYAGFFGIWATVRGSMNPWDVKLLAVILGISLLLFIVWTIIQMLAVMKGTVALGEVIGTPHSSMEDHINAIVAQELENKRQTIRLQKMWRWFFVSTVITGFSAAIGLILLLMMDLLEIPFSFHDLFKG